MLWSHPRTIDVGMREVPIITSLFVVASLGLTGESGARADEPRAATAPSQVGRWLDRSLFSTDAKRRRGFSTRLWGDRYRSQIYTKPKARAYGRGQVLRGVSVWGKPAGSRSGCRGGWYELSSGGFACSSGSFRTKAESSERPSPPPDLSSPLPYRYVRVAVDGAPRYESLPTPEEESLDGKSGPVDVNMEGDYFLAIAAEERDAGRVFYRTLSGKFVNRDVVEEIGRAHV